MAKTINDLVLDGALDVTATGTLMNVCSSEPANRAAAVAASLADVVLTAGDGGGDYVIANGDTSGDRRASCRERVYGSV